MKGVVGKEVDTCIRLFSSRLECEVVELTVVEDHVHLLVKIPPKLSISKFMGIIKGRTAIRVFQKFPNLKNKPYWGNHFWAQGYCVDSIGLNEDMIRKYVKYQEKNEN